MNSPCSKLQGITSASLHFADGKVRVDFWFIPPASSREFGFKYQSNRDFGFKDFVNLFITIA
jgi:hypothetical protein